MGLFDSLNEENRIFKNELAFNQEYIPEEILHRENQIKEIAYSLKGIVKGVKENVFLHGPTGTGKTSCARYVLRELENYSEKAVGIYLNCWNYSTRYSVLNQIAYSLDSFVPRRGLAADQLIEIITDFSKSEGKVPVVILDEVDMLGKKGEADVLYDLLRMEESLGGKIVCILITNEQEFIAKLDRRVKSSFAQKTIQFCPYRPSELRDILKERARIGLLPESYGEEVLGICAGFGARHRGDARIAIKLLFNSAKEAEKQGNKKIEVSDVEKCKNEVLFEIEEGKKELLNENEKKVLETIGGEWNESSELYKKVKIDKRIIRMSIEQLERLGFIETKQEKSKTSKFIRRKK